MVVCNFFQIKKINYSMTIGNKKIFFQTHFNQLYIATLYYTTFNNFYI